jgi:hypothetical protein
VTRSRTTLASKVAGIASRSRFDISPYFVQVIAPLLDGKVAGWNQKWEGVGSFGPLAWAGFRCQVNALENLYGEEQDSSFSENALRPA